MMGTSALPCVRWTNPSLERQILDAIVLDVPWSLVERFASLVRLSGSAQEREAVEIVIDHLRAWGIPHHLYEPEAFISIPLGAGIRAGGKAFYAKTPAMSVSTGGQEITGELVYVPGDVPRHGGEQTDDDDGGNDVFSSGIDLDESTMRGKIVLTEGLALPAKVADAMKVGALAAIFINPGDAIHEGICTATWGTPDLASLAYQPTIPVVAVNNPDGQELIALARQGGPVQAALSTTLDTGWRRIPVLVAEIPGRRWPDEFVLLHGHLDSWHVGVSDNATGDAALLELARVFWAQRDQLARSLRVAWWSGHSHGRYAGSTWYADTFGIDLAHNCVAQINCDSPGCRWADTYNNLNVMSEAGPLVDAVVRDTTGIVPRMERPQRAGDYSFNGIGLTSFYMASSTMSEQARVARGYYPVGGSGGNIEWHTEADTLEVADRDVLLRDMRLYAASVLRTLDAPVHPFDWTRTTAEFRRTLAAYQEAAGDQFDVTPARDAVDALEQALERFYAQAPADDRAEDAAVARFNRVQRRLGRLLIPVNFSQMPPFYHDPALAVPPLPDLAAALTLPAARNDVARRGILRAQLTRGQNRLVWALQLARETVQAATGV